SAFRFWSRCPQKRMGSERPARSKTASLVIEGISSYNARAAREVAPRAEAAVRPCFLPKRPRRRENLGENDRRAGVRGVSERGEQAARREGAGGGRGAEQRRRHRRREAGLRARAER